MQVLDSGLDKLHVPYSYGFSIILLTVLVKALTFPLSRKQVLLCPALLASTHSAANYHLESFLLIITKEQCS